MTTSSGILPILLRRKRLLLLSGVATACLGFAGSRVLPLQYASEGSIIIDNRSASTTDSSASQTVLTEVDVLQSRGLIRRGVIDYKLDKLADLVPQSRLPLVIKLPLINLRNEIFGLWQSINSNPHNDSEIDKVIDYVQKHIKVGAKEKSYVISVQAEAGSAATAATVADAIMGTYLHAVESARDDRVATADKWIAKQTADHKLEVEIAENNVAKFVAEHPLPEVQGSLTTAIQLSKDQEELVLAREDLAKKQAALDSLAQGGRVAQSATIDSQTLVALKNLEATLNTQRDHLTQIDPRRDLMQAAINSLKGKMGDEKELVFASLIREKQIALARVAALEETVKAEGEVAHNASMAGSALKQLMSDLDTKRQLFVTFLSQAEQAHIAAAQAPTAHRLFQALPPERPAHSLGILSLILGFVAGVVGASATVVLRNMMNSKINSTEDMAFATGLRTFGSLPDIKWSRDTMSGIPLIAETFRAMWVTMRPQKDRGSVILVTSSEIGEGKTTVAVALAQRFADDGFRVLLVDADLRHCRLSGMFEAEPLIYLHDAKQGLESMLNGDVPFEQAVVNVRPNLDCLLTKGSKNPIRDLSSERFSEILALSQSTYDFVILDSPPVLHVADPVVLAKLSQHIVFIVQAGRLPNEMVTEAIRRFSDDDQTKMVTLLSRVRRRLMNKVDYYSGYVSQ